VAGENDLKIEADLDLELIPEAVQTQLDALGPLLAGTMASAATQAQRELVNGLDDAMRIVRARLEVLSNQTIKGTGAAARRQRAELQGELNAQLRVVQEFYRQNNEIQRRIELDTAERERNRRADERATTQEQNRNKREQLAATQATNKALNEEDKRLTITKRAEEERRTEATKQGNREQLAAVRFGQRQILEAQMADDKIDLANRRAHNARLNDLTRSITDSLRVTWRDFHARRREDERQANRLAAIEAERAAKEQLQVQQATLAGQATSVANSGVTGAVLGRSGLGIGLRNLAIAGGGAFGALNTFKIGSEFTTGLEVARAQLGLTSKEMDLLGQKALELGNDVKLPGVSARDAADAILQLAKAGLSVNDALGSANATLQLGRAVNADYAETAFQVGVALNVFKLQAKDSNDVADILAKTVGISGGTSFADLSDAIKQSTTVFAANQREIGKGTDAYIQQAAAISILAKNALRGSDAGTSLKQFLLAFSNSSLPVRSALKDLAEQAGVQSIAYDEATGSARPFNEIIKLLAKSVKGLTQEEREAKFTQIFGSDATRAVNALTSNVTGLDQAIVSLRNSQRSVSGKGFAQKLAEAQNTGLKGAFDAIRSQFETFQIQIFRLLDKPLGNAILRIATAIGALATAPEWGTLRRTIVALAAAGAALLVFKSAGEAMQLASLGIKALATSPTALVTLGLGGIVVGLATAVQKSHEFNKSFVGGLNDLARGITGSPLPAKIRELLLPSDLKPLSKDPKVQEFLATLQEEPPKDNFFTRTGRNIADGYRAIVDGATATQKALENSKAFFDSGVSSGKNGEQIDQQKADALGFSAQRVFGTLGVAAGLAFNGEFVKSLAALNTLILPALRSAGHAIADAYRAIFDGGAEILPKVVGFINDIIPPREQIIQFGKELGTFLLDGIYQAGKLIPTILLDHRTIEAVVAAGGAVAAAAVVIGGQFALGMVQGIIAQRGEIAKAVKDIFKALFDINPIIGGVVTAFVAGFAILKTIKVFGSLKADADVFLVNVRAGWKALHGDVAGAKALITEFNKQRADGALQGVKGLGQGFIQLGADVEKSLQKIRSVATTTSAVAARVRAELGSTGAMSIAAGPTLPPELAAQLRREQAVIGSTTARINAGLTGQFFTPQQAVAAAQRTLSISPAAVAGQFFLPAQATAAGQAQAAADVRAATLRATAAATASSVSNSFFLPAQATAAGQAQAARDAARQTAIKTGQQSVLSSFFTPQQAVASANAMQETTRFAGALSKAFDGVALAATIAGAGVAGYNAAQSNGIEKAVSYAGVIGTVGTAFAIGGPAAGVLAGGVAVLGTVLGNHAKKAAEARARQAEYAEILKSSIPAVEALSRYEQKLESGSGTQKRILNDLTGLGFSLGQLDAAVRGSDESFVSFRTSVNAAAEAANFGYNGRSDLIRFLGEERKAALGAAEAQERVAKARSAGGQVDPEVLKQAATYGGMYSISAQQIADAAEAAGPYVKTQREEQERLNAAIRTFAELTGRVSVSAASLSNDVLSTVKANKELYQKALQGDVVAANQLAINNQQIADSFQTQVKALLDGAKDVPGGFDTATGKIQEIFDKVSGDIQKSLKLPREEADKIAATMLGLKELSSNAITFDLRWRLIVDEKTKKALIAAANASAASNVDAGVGAAAIADAFAVAGLDPVNSENGRVVTRPTLSWIGERSKPEVVIPLSNPRRALQLMRETNLDRALLASLAGTSSSGGSTTASAAAPVSAASTFGGPVVGELHVHEVAADPIATGTLVGHKIRAIVQEALR